MVGFLGKYKSLLTIGGIILVIVLIKVLIIDRLFSKKEFVPQSDIASTLSDSQANAMAERLWQAMAVTPFGTDETEVFKVLEHLTTADYNKVYNAFGLRPYSMLFGSQDTSINPLVEGRNLTEIIINELSTSELEDLKKLNSRLPL